MGYRTGALRARPVRARILNRYSGRKARERRFGESYEGPLDLVPGAVAAYSVSRALSSGWIGENVLRILRDDMEEMEFSAGPDGLVDAAAISTWLGEQSGTINKLYDQSGNGLHLVDGSFPTWIASSQGGRAAFGSTTLLTSDVLLTTIAFPVPSFTCFLMGKGITRFQANPTDNNLSYVHMRGGSQAKLDIFDNANGGEAGGEFGGLSDAVFLLCDAVAVHGGSAYKANGADVALTLDYDLETAPGPFSDFITILRTNSVLQESIIYNVVKNDADRLLVRQNIAAYYGITLP